MSRAHDLLRFDGSVAIITGAGRGLGYAYARMLAERGACVVVNDLGSGVAGLGADPGVASQAVDELKKCGLAAEANASDVSTAEGARELVEHALECYRRIDILVNNAGIFGTDQFPDVDLDDLNRQLAVHVEGSFNVTRAVWPHMASARYGRIVMTTSSGALGSASLTSYGTAKAAVIGLCRSLAMSGRDLHILVNAVAPMAMTRMMRTRLNQQPPTQITDERDPALAAPLIALLSHERCPTTGEIFSCGMRRFSRLVMAESGGYIHPNNDISPEAVLSRWDEVMDASELRVVTDTDSWASDHFALLASADRLQCD